MLYMRCPSCGEVLGNKEIIYINKMKEVCESLNIDDNLVSLHNLDNDEAYIKKRQEIIKELFTNYCCRIRAMEYIDIVQVIK